MRPLVCIRKLLPVSVFDDETPVGLFGRPRRPESALKTDEATPPIELPDGRRAVVTADGLEGLAGRVAALSRFHQPVAQFLNFPAKGLLLCRDGVQIAPQALLAQIRD